MNPTDWLRLDALLDNAAADLRDDTESPEGPVIAGWCGELTGDERSAAVLNAVSILVENRLGDFIDGVVCALDGAEDGSFVAIRQAAVILVGEIQAQGAEEDSFTALARAEVLQRADSLAFFRAEAGRVAA